MLYRMEKKGWVHSEQGRSENNRKARFYSLTAAGREHLDIEQTQWHEFQSIVSRILKKA